MKFIIVLALAVAAMAAPQMQMSQSQLAATTPVPILEFEASHDNERNFQSRFRSGNGIVQEASGSLKPLDSDHPDEGPSFVQRGQYSFVGDDGKQYTVDWTADENGFQAKGEHLPTPPPIPAEIQKSLAEQNVASPF